jgi:hypothetical protein
VNVLINLLYLNNITISKRDIEHILAYFGGVEVGTKKAVVKTREVEPATCCGTKEAMSIK